MNDGVLPVAPPVLSRAFQELRETLLAPESSENDRNPMKSLKPGAVAGHREPTERAEDRRLPIPLPLCTGERHHAPAALGAHAGSLS